jgi:hypothetical protein
VTREYPEWEMSDEARQQLNDKITGEHFAGLEEPQTPADVRRLQDEYGRENLTAWLAGTTDRSSRAWKSARDGLSRRRTGRQGIGKLWRDKFRTAGRRGRTSGIRAHGALNVRLTADVKVSTKWDRQRPMSATLTGSDLADYLDALESGNVEQAAMVVADAYGIPPEAITELDNISGFESDLAALDEDDEDDED